jgi:hypothetical protein
MRTIRFLKIITVGVPLNIFHDIASLYFLELIPTLMQHIRPIITPIPEKTSQRILTISGLKKYPSKKKTIPKARNIKPQHLHLPMLSFIISPILQSLSQQFIVNLPLKSSLLRLQTSDYMIFSVITEKTPPTRHLWYNLPE